jgi:hypothetical protein
VLLVIIHELSWAQGEKSVDKPPCHLTKYLSATEHEEGQVIDPMHLCS